VFLLSGKDVTNITIDSDICFAYIAVMVPMGDAADHSLRQDQPRKTFAKWHLRYVGTAEHAIFWPLVSLI
jgi:hypothetical protein